MARGTLTYALTSILQRSLGFLLLPVYTRVLDPFEYGQVGIIATLSAAIGTVLALGLETAVFRTYLQLGESPDKRHSFLNTVGLFGLTFPVAVAVAVAPPIAVFGEGLFGTPGMAVGLGVLSAGLNAAITILPFAVLRAEERFRDYVRLSGLQALLGTCLTLLFVVAFRWGVIGWMLATAMTALVTLLSGLGTLRHQWSRRLELGYLKAALVFGIPLVPHAASHWGLALSDRAVLGALLPTSDVGIYHLAYQFSIPITVIGVALSQSTQTLFAEAGTRPERRSDIEHLATKQIMAVAFLALTVALLGPAAIHAVLPDAYLAATGYVPWIALGALLFSIYLVPMNAIAVMAGTSRWVWVVTVTAAAVNVILNVLFVPRFGALAAAVNTAVGYGVLLVGVTTFMILTVHPPLRFEVRRVGGGLLLVAVIALVAYALSESLTWPVQVFVRSGMLLVALIVLVQARLLPTPAAFLARLNAQR